MSFTWEELDAMRPKDDWPVPIPPTCRNCDYFLTGLREHRCPECGTPFEWKEVRKRAAVTWSLTNRLKHANKDAMAGLIFGLSGWAALGLFRLIGFRLLLFQLLYLLIAVITIILGSQVLNLRRVPKWARVYIGDPPPNVWLGYGVLLLGFGLMFGSVVLA